MAVLDERDRLKEENRKLQEAVYKEHGGKGFCIKINSTRY